MIKAIKGTRDILPPSSAVWNRVESIAREVFRTFNYHEIRTPIFEETALFARGVGEDTDIVGKEMYTWEDRDGTSLTLRPEATASVMRAYIEHRLDQQPFMKRLYYIGPMFRRERPQKGRYRQFYQIGAEALGSDASTTDADLIEMVMEFLRRVGLTGTRLLINSVGHNRPDCRPRYMEALRERLRDVAPTMCADCQRRAVTNPLRVLDCKVPADQPIIETLPSILDYLCLFCRPHFDQVRGHLDNRGIAYEVKPRLVRGLDYYMRTTFEVVHGSLGAQSAVLGGGRYDGLAESLGSNIRAPGIGFSIGEDRLAMLLEESGAAGPDRLDVYFAYIAADNNFDRPAEIAIELRRQGISVEIGYPPDSGTLRLKRALEFANKMNARFTLILGDNEIAAGTYLLKDMASGEQESLSRDQLAARIRGK